MLYLTFSTFEDYIAHLKSLRSTVRDSHLDIADLSGSEGYAFFLVATALVSANIICCCEPINLRSAVVSDEPKSPDVVQRAVAATLVAELAAMKKQFAAAKLRVARGILTTETPYILKHTK